MMLEYPQSNDVIDILLDLTRRQDFTRIKQIEMALKLLKEQLNHPHVELEEQTALARYFKEEVLDIKEGRRLLAEGMRKGSLPDKLDSILLKDLLLKLVVPYLRIVNPKYIAQRQREKRVAESAI